MITIFTDCSWVRRKAFYTALIFQDNAFMEMHSDFVVCENSTVGELHGILFALSIVNSCAGETEEITIHCDNISNMDIMKRILQSGNISKEIGNRVLWNKVMRQIGSHTVYPVWFEGHKVGSLNPNKVCDFLSHRLLETIK